MRKGLLFFVVAALVFSLTAIGYAAKYPIKPVKIIVAFSAGGGTDTAARVMAKFAKKYFPQPFVVINKPGAGGQIGFEALAFSRKDGYTIGFINTPHVVSHYVSGRAKYKLSDFQPICNVVTDPGVLAVRANDNRFKTLKDIVEYAKKHPGKLSAATTGPGGDDSIALALFTDEANIKIKDVPFGGSSKEKAALLGGHVDIGMVNVSQIWSLVSAGKLRMIAVMTKKRLPYLPKIPTFKEFGYEVYSDSSRGIAAPKGIPEYAFKKLSETFAKVMKDPGFIKEAKKIHLLLNYMDAKQFEEYLKAEEKLIRKVYKKHPW